MQKITPFLWFNDQAEDAVGFYTAIFKNSRIVAVTRYGKSGGSVSGRPTGSVMTIVFELEGQQFTALNGGSVFRFNEAISLVVNCDTQQELDFFWEKLSEGGEQGHCGWLKDKYGLSWQVVPRAIGEMLRDDDPAKFERVMAAILKMGKLEIDALKRAYHDA